MKAAAWRQRQRHRVGRLLRSSGELGAHSVPVGCENNPCPRRTKRPPDSTRTRRQWSPFSQSENILMVSRGRPTKSSEFHRVAAKRSYCRTNLYTPAACMGRSPKGCSIQPSTSMEAPRWMKFTSITKRMCLSRRIFFPWSPARGPAVITADMPGWRRSPGATGGAALHQTVNPRKVHPQLIPVGNGAHADHLLGLEGCQAGGFMAPRKTHPGNRGPCAASGRPRFCHCFLYKGKEEVVT